MLSLYDSVCRSELDCGSRIHSSACELKLRKLNVIHNTGQKICIRAFEISSVESLYVDSHELPLDFRREELGL